MTARRFFLSRLVFHLAVVALFVFACATSFVVGRTAQVPSPGPQLTSAVRGGLRMLLDRNSLGGPEVSVGERTYPANYESAEHTHQSIEILYVLSGQFQHVINGQTHVLDAGMVGYVKPGDKVRHKTGSKGPAKTLMVWVPGDDGDRLAEGWRAQ